MDYFFLAINFICTAAINLTPALAIRYLIKKEPFKAKRNAIIACICIAIFGWTIAYIIAFSSIGSGVVPAGFAEIIFACINYRMLKPKEGASANIIHNEADKVYEVNEELESEQNAAVTNTEPAYSKSARILNIVLSLALIVSVVYCFTLNQSLNETKDELEESNKRLERVTYARDKMVESYEEEIEKLYDRLFPNRDEELAKELKKMDEKHKQSIDEWNRNNPDQKFNYDGEPIE